MNLNFLPVLLGTIADTAKALPLLFLAYLAIEWVERRPGDSLDRLLARGGRMGPVVGSLLGALPQCGFSAAAANLFASRMISVGTILAVFLATSDEAIPLMFANPSAWPALIAIVVGKTAFAMVLGLAIDRVPRKVLPAPLRTAFSGHASDVDCHVHHEDAPDDAEGSMFRAAFVHTLQIAFFLLVCSFVLELAVDAIGEERFAAFLGSLGFAQPLVAALVGLIPNCAASVLLVELHGAGSISFASLAAGLSAGAGTGLAVLWRVAPRRQAFAITALLWLLGALLGIILNLI